MSSTERRSMISVDQFVGAPATRVWRFLTEPDLLGRWWVPGDVTHTVGDTFHLQMPGWGAVRCEVLTSEPPRLFVHTFGDDWTLSWRLVPEGDGTRLLLEHSGFDLDDPRARAAFERMTGGWRSTVLPALATAATTP